MVKLVVIKFWNQHTSSTCDQLQPPKPQTRPNVQDTRYVLLLCSAEARGTGSVKSKDDCWRRRKGSARQQCQKGPQRKTSNTPRGGRGRLERGGGGISSQQQDLTVLPASRLTSHFFFWEELSHSRYVLDKAEIPTVEIHRHFKQRLQK